VSRVVLDVDPADPCMSGVGGRGEWPWIRTRVVFPAPLGPSRPLHAPRRYAQVDADKALVSPNALLTPSTSIMAALLWEMAVAVISTLSENEGSPWRLTSRPSAVGAEGSEWRR